MRRSSAHVLTLAGLISLSPAIARAQQDLANAPPGRAMNQPIDSEYTKKIKEYTTEPFFLSPLVDYMPAKAGVPTPKAVLGDIAGAPGKLPYSKEVYEYMRLLAKAMPNRVKVYVDRHDRRGTRAHRRRDRVGSDHGEARRRTRPTLAKLADPRTIQMNDKQAAADRQHGGARLLHHRHDPLDRSRRADGAHGARVSSGGGRRARTSRNIRDHVITLITPIVEVDGRDRMVDVYNWKKAHPGRGRAGRRSTGATTSRHDNNRDAMGMTLKLTQNVLNDVRRLEGAGAARPARVGRVHVRQHDRRRPLQLVARSAA